MSDQKVFVFGSFTEDEIKSLHRQPPETNVEIKFGSLDSVTLRSVGKPNTKLEKRPSELVNTELAAVLCKIECTTQTVARNINENGSIHDTCNIRHSDDVTDGIQELKIQTVELPVACGSKDVSDPSKQHVSQGLTVLSNLLTNESLVDTPEGLDIVDPKKFPLRESNCPRANVRNLLPRGLVNLGNLCFLNATLQAFLSCPPFVQLLQELSARNIPEIGYPTLRAFVEFFSDFDNHNGSSSKKKEMVLGTGRPFRPVMFESILESFTPDVQNGIFGRPRQEDAVEFLCFVMHQMHDELVKLEGQVPSNVGGKSSLVSSVDVEDEIDGWETVGPKNKTAITRTQNFLPSKLSAIFGGQLRSVVKAKGIKASATIQPFLLLHLNICPEPVHTIEDALHLFSAPETLEGYRASGAGKAEVVNASKSVKILQLSEIMILHLMRFSYGSQGSTKLHKPVRFPLELVVSRGMLVSPSSEGRRYELVAIITHHGREPSKGHYTADTRQPNGQWLHYDDASVTVIPISKVLQEQAYVLFYRRL